MRESTRRERYNVVSAQELMLGRNKTAILADGIPEGGLIVILHDGTKEFFSYCAGPCVIQSRGNMVQVGKISL